MRTIDSFYKCRLRRYQNFDAAAPCEQGALTGNNISELFSVPALARTSLNNRQHEQKLEPIVAPQQPTAMSTREAVQAILNQLPSDISLHEVAREIEFIAAVREGMAELDRGEGIPVDQVREELHSWVKR